MDKRGPKASQDTRDVRRSIRGRITLFGVCTKPGLWIKAVRRDQYALGCMPDNLKMQKICNKAMRGNLAAFFSSLTVSKHKKCAMRLLRSTHGSCMMYLITLKRKKCDDRVQGDSYSLQFVPDWFVTQEQLETWHDDNDYCNDDELIKWYKRHDKRKAQKAKIKEELMPIAWHPNRVMDWCMPEDEKRRRK